MVLIDTSIWIDHLRMRDELLVELLATGLVLIHPFVLGELALGGLKDRESILEDLKNLPPATVAADEEVRDLIDRHALFGIGIGYVDASLLASVVLMPGSWLWTRDKRLGDAEHRVRAGTAAFH